MEPDLTPYQAAATLDARAVLVVAPHADDEVFGCGGAIAAHVQHGTPVHVVVLTDGARADSVPNLEIETGEIEGAGHSSSTGRFDELQLFYLRSRGIPEREARRLVVHGFFWDIIRRIGVDDIEKKLLERVEREIDAVEAAE